MRRHLLSILAIGALFASSCKKANEFTEPQLQDENQRIANTGTGPTAVTTPTVYFMKGDRLWSIKNLSAANPTLKDEGQVTNIEIYNDVSKTNVFNTYHKRVLYSPLTDRMISINNNSTLYKCFIPTRGTVKTFMSNSIGGTLVGLSPDQKLYYYTQAIEGDVNPYSTTQLRRMNMDGTGDEEVFIYDAADKIITSYEKCDINFDKNVIYGPHNDGNIYETVLGGGMFVDQKLLVPALSASFAKSVIRYNPKNKMLFFTGKLNGTNKIRIFSMDPSIGLNSIKMIFETSLSADSEFNFTISPSTNTIVWCKATFNQKTGVQFSEIGKVGLDGQNAKVLTSGNFTTHTVVAAEPAN